MIPILSPADQLAVMLAVAATAHKTQRDNAGRPYFLHCKQVMDNLPSHVCDLVRAAAIGHDLFEDTDITPLDLKNMGICDQVIGDIILVTNLDIRTGVKYSAAEYHQRCMSNIRVIMIKIGDLKHNSDISRMKNKKPGAKDFARTMLYMEFYAELEEKYNEEMNQHEH